MRRGRQKARARGVLVLLAPLYPASRDWRDKPRSRYLWFYSHIYRFAATYTYLILEQVGSARGFAYLRRQATPDPDASLFVLLNKRHCRIVLSLEIS